MAQLSQKDVTELTQECCADIPDRLRVGHGRKSGWYPWCKKGAERWARGRRWAVGPLRDPAGRARPLPGPPAPCRRPVPLRRCRRLPRPPGITMPRGDPGDPPDRETVGGLGNAKDRFFLAPPPRPW